MAESTSCTLVWAGWREGEGGEGRGGEGRGGRGRGRERERERVTVSDAGIKVMNFGDFPLRVFTPFQKPRIANRGA